MSIIFKLNTQKIFLGDKEVSEVYKGIKKVYEKITKTPLEVFMDKWGHIFNSEAAFTSGVRTGEVFEWVCPPDVYSVSVVAVGSGGQSDTGGRARFEGDEGVFVQGNGGGWNGSGGSYTGSGGGSGDSNFRGNGGGAGGYATTAGGGGGRGSDYQYGSSGGNVYLYGQGTVGSGAFSPGSSDTLRIHKILNESLEIPYFQDQSISGGGGRANGASYATTAGGGGGLGWRNNIPVTPGQTYNVYINQNGGSSSAGNAALRIVWTPPGMELVREFPNTNVYALVNWYLENNSEFIADYNALTTNI